MSRSAPARVRHWRRRTHAGAAASVLLGLGLVAPAVHADLIAFRDRLAPPSWPPFVLVRTHPAVPLPPRVLGLGATYESFAYPDRAADAADPALALLAAGRVDRIGVDLGYGLGAGLTARAAFSGLAGDLPGAESMSGLEDGLLALAFARSFAGARLRARLEGGAWLPIGSDATFRTGAGPAAAPFSAGATRPLAGAGLTVALTRPDAPVVIHAHAEATWVAGGRSESDRSFLPFRERMPFLTLGATAHDRLDLRAALALTQGRAALFFEYERPRLQGAEAISPGEVPQSLSPGFALRFAGVELGAQADLLLATDDARTEFDPRLIYPEWALRIRIGTDLVPRDADHDGDGIGDLGDGCPRVAEDRDGFADGDGCPDPDNDGDGLPDASDACPSAPEDRDGYQDADGCPDPDDDGDLIPDSSDDCPRSPEDRDGFEDEDGCPEPGGAAEVAPAPPAEMPPAGAPPAPDADSVPQSEEETP